MFNITRLVSATKAKRQTFKRNRSTNKKAPIAVGAFFIYCMYMKLWTPTLVTGPAIEPITIAEMKTHLRIDGSNTEPDPSTTPTAALAAGGAGNLSNGVYRYKVTFVTADGETLSSTPSDAITVTDNSTDGQVSLTSIPLGGGAVTSRKLYRTAVGGGTYLLLATLSNNTATTYTDNIADGSLGAGEPSTNTTDDPEIYGLIQLVRQKVEQDTGVLCITQTIKHTSNGIPITCRYGESFVNLQKRPLQSGTVIVTYTDTNGDVQTWDSSSYELSGVDTSDVHPELAPTFGSSFPVLQSGRNTFNVQGTYGFGDTASDVPEPLKHAMKLLAGTYYNIRDSVLPGVTSVEVPQGYESLISAYREPRF